MDGLGVDALPLHLGAGTISAERFRDLVANLHHLEMPTNFWLGGITLVHRTAVRFEKFSFGVLRIDGVTYERDVVIDRGRVRARKKKPSRRFRADYGHTPLSVEEKIPWKCRRLVVGTGAEAALPVMDDVRREAERRGVKLMVLPTPAAIKSLERDRRDTNAILHVTC